MLKNRVKLYSLILMGFLTSTSSMIYELLISQMLGQLTNQLMTWQCISIGVYIGGLGLGAWRSSSISPSLKRKEFLKIEINLCLLGTLLISVIGIAHIIYRTFIYIPLGANQYSILFFTLTSEALGFIIGYYSGMEIPLLSHFWQEEKPFLSKNEIVKMTPSTAMILAISYFGSFCGSLLFSLWLYPQFHYVKTALIAALINFIIGFLFLAIYRPIINFWNKIYFIFVGVLFYFMIPISTQIYQLTLQNYYYGLSLNSIRFTPLLLERLFQSPPVEQIITPLQTIDIVYSHPSMDMPFINHHPLVRPYRLYLDQRLQYFTADEYTYHETMVHIPLQLIPKIPQSVLVLGGGDGLIVRELLKYSEIKKITLVELDTEILKLAMETPLFTQVNEGSLKNPRVQIIQGDAFHFARTTSEKYDAVFADFPWPFQYDLAKLYSVEFYSELLKLTQDEGFLMLDFPILKSMTDFEKYLSTLKATLMEAGFKNPISVTLNKESFLLSLKREQPLNFIKKDLGFEIKIPINENLDFLKTFYEFNKRNVIPKNTQINSIYKPTILDIVDPRF